MNQMKDIFFYKRKPVGNSGPGRTQGQKERNMTYGRGLSSIGKVHKRQIKFMDAWQMNTIRSAVAYESVAAR
jgi:hypothetical protein